MLSEIVTVLHVFSHDQISHQRTHDESEDSPRMRHEPGSCSRDGQPIRVDAPDHAEIPGDVEMPGEEFEVGANDETPNFQSVPDQPFDGNVVYRYLSSSSDEHHLLRSCLGTGMRVGT